MPSYKLRFYPCRDIVEVSRQMLHLSGTSFEDIRISMEEWPKHKKSTPFGQLPVLHVDGKALPQSFAIARYLANQFGFAGQTQFEAAWVDALADQHKDYIAEIKPFLLLVYGFGSGDKEQLQRDVAEPAIHKYFSILEKRAKDNCSNGHFVGTSLTWIDLVVTDHVEVLESFIPNALADFPLVREITRKTVSHPKLKEWIYKRPITAF